MIKWIKLSFPECLAQDPNLIYVVPCDDGSTIWLNGEYCLIEDVTVQEIIDKFNTIGCTSFQLQKEEIETMIEELKKEKTNEYCYLSRKF